MPYPEGGKTWGAIGHKISHVGPFDYNGRYLDEVEKQAMANHVAGLEQSNGSTIPDLSPQAENFVEAVKAEAEPVLQASE